MWNETVRGTDYRGSDLKVQHHDGLADVTTLGDLVTVGQSVQRPRQVVPDRGTDTASITGSATSITAAAGARTNL